MAVVWALSPTAAAVGAVRLLDAWRSTPDRVWDGARLDDKGLTRARYDALVDGAPAIVCVRVEQATRMEPVALAELRTLVGACPRGEDWSALSAAEYRALLDRWGVEA